MPEGIMSIVPGSVSTSPRSEPGVLVCPAEPGLLASWLLEAAPSSKGMAVALDFSMAHWVVRPMEVVDLLARLSVDVVRVTGLPPDLMQSVRFLFAAPQVPSWRAVPDVDPRSIDYRVRSGVCVTHLSGDVELLDTLAAGGDVRAGGSVRIAGAMRGTVTAGHLGLSTAAIVCRSFNPELVSICGAFVTGDRLDPALIGRAVRITLSSGGIRFQPVDPATV